MSTTVACSLTVRPFPDDSVIRYCRVGTSARRSLTLGDLKIRYVEIQQPCGNLEEAAIHLLSPVLVAAACLHSNSRGHMDTIERLAIMNHAWEMRLL